jgi:hypothetical protein
MAYRVALVLENTVGLGPEWLPTAVRASVPGAELVSVESYDEHTAVIIVRGAVPAVGETLSPGAEGLSLPLAATPKGTVTAASEALDAAVPVTDTGKAALSVLAAVGLLAAVWYLIARIQ